MFLRVAGLPVLPRMDLAVQRRRTVSRCQRRIVSGVTSSRSMWRRALGITPCRVAIRARSAQSRFGRRGCCRCRTASWWRRIKISAVYHASSRRDSRSHAASRVISRKTNRRHMIGDHHGRTAGRATLLGQSRGLDSWQHRTGTSSSLKSMARRPSWVWPGASARSASVLVCRRPLMMAVGSAQPWQRRGARRREPGAVLELIEQTVRAVGIA